MIPCIPEKILHPFIPLVECFVSDVMRKKLADNLTL